MKMQGGFLIAAIFTLLAGCATEKPVANNVTPTRTSRHPASQAPIVPAEISAKIDAIQTACPKPKRKREYSSNEFETLYACFENQINEVDDLIIAVWSDHLNGGSAAKTGDDHRLEIQLRLLRKELNAQFDAWLEN